MAGVGEIGYCLIWGALAPGQEALNGGLTPGLLQGMAVGLQNCTSMLHRIILLKT